MIDRPATAALRTAAKVPPTPNARPSGTPHTTATSSTPRRPTHSQTDHGGRVRIEKVINTFWDGPTMPDYVRRSIESWERHYPDWEIRIWNERTIPKLRNQDLYDNWQTVSPKSSEWQFKTNLLRLELIHDRGQCWFDADLMALRNAEELLADHDAFVVQESERYLNNGLTGATAGHPYFEDMLNTVRHRILRNPHKRSNRTCGPHLYTETHKRNPDVHVIPREQGHPARWDQLEATPEDFPDAYFFHWWGNKRRQM